MNYYQVYPGSWTMRLIINICCTTLIMQIREACSCLLSSPLHILALLKAGRGRQPASHLGTNQMIAFVMKEGRRLHAYLQTCGDIGGQTEPEV